MIWNPATLLTPFVNYLPLRTLWSSVAGVLKVPSKSQKKIKDAAFDSYSPKLRNTLPVDTVSETLLNNVYKKAKNTPVHCSI